MSAPSPRYVNEECAARLIGLPVGDLRRISGECHLGHHERCGDAEETYFTYEELRRICQLAVQQVH